MTSVATAVDEEEEDDDVVDVGVDVDLSRAPIPSIVNTGVPLASVQHIHTTS